jgi:aspartate/methionine/tyrosine aminotransferase
VILTPGSYFGAAGDGYLRLALVPTQAECERAAEMVARLPY